MATPDIHHPLTLEDPGAGEQFVFLRSARGPGGRFAFRWTLAPGKTGPGEHVHPETESFRIVSGTLRIWIDGAPRDLGPGDAIDAPRGVPHRFLNPGTEPVVVDVELDGTRMEDQMIPMAVHFQPAIRAGRKPRLRDVLRMIVHIEQVGAVRIASRFKMAMFRGFARTLRLFGVRGFSAVIGWEPGEGRASAPAAAPPAVAVARGHA